MTLHVPEVIDLEICQALRRYVRLGGLETERARATLELFGQLDLTRYSHEPLLSRVWELRRNFTAYDAAYVALSEALGAPLLTADQRLARGMVGTATIELA